MGVAGVGLGVGAVYRYEFSMQHLDNLIFLKKVQARVMVVM